MNEGALFTLSGLCSALIAFLFGPIDILFLSFLSILVIVQISILLRALYEEDKRITKAGIARSISKTLLLIVVVVIANLIDVLIGLGGILRSGALGFLIASESLKILENCAACGIAIPKRLLEALDVLKSKSNKDDIKEEE